MSGRRARRAQRPSTRSQHFLRTSALAAQLVGEACIQPDDLVLDLGAGSGRLTAELAQVARHVLAVELDPAWATALRGRWPNVEVIEGDAACIRLPREPFRVLANLPFDRTTDLLRLLLDDPRAALVRADMIVEWAVAIKRGLPWPSTLNDVLWGAFYETSVARRLPRIAFRPSPTADGGVLVFRRRATPLIPLELAHSYRRFAARGFRRGLQSVAAPRALKGVAERGATARDLDAHQWAEVFLRQRDVVDKRPWRPRIPPRANPETAE